LNEQRLLRFAPAIVVIVGALLFLPMLGGIGFWDPYEIRIADGARHVASGVATAPQALPTGTPSFLAPQLGRPPAWVWLPAMGMKHLGISELGARMPIALSSVLFLVAAWLLGRRTLGKRAALLGVFAAATTPLVLFGGRQLTTAAPLLLGTTLTVAGLAGALAPATGTPPLLRLVDLLLAAGGLFVGLTSGGLLVGIVAPLLAVVVALLLAPRDAVPVAGRAGAAIVGLGAMGVVAGMLFERNTALSYSPWLGGPVHALQHHVVLTQHLFKTGIQLFPWVALVPVAIARGLGDRKTGEETSTLGRPLLVAWAITSWLASLLQAAAVQELPTAHVVPMALLCGALLDDLLRDPRPQPFAGIAVAVVAVVVGRDLLGAPEAFIGAHVLEAVRWPGGMPLPPLILFGEGVFFGAVAALALGVRVAPDWMIGVDDARALRGRRLLVGATVGAAALVAFTGVAYVIPVASKHLSARDVYGKTAKLDPNAPVAQYRFNASGASFYAGGRTPQTLQSVGELVEFLKKPERVFVLAGAEELAPIDQAARQAQVPYVVVDDTSSRFLVLSNRLGPNERDLNPMRRFVLDTPPKPAFPLEVDFEGKVKLLGYDLPSQLERGADFHIRLYFQVLQPLGGSYKVFVHFDGSGTRFNGDHVPVEGRFPTQYWVPGSYIVDDHLIQPEKAFQPSGAYRVFMGFFLGDKRLKVTSGPHDGENRVKLGNTVVR
jgi:hypothetical protein